MDRRSLILGGMASAAKSLLSNPAHRSPMQVISDGAGIDSLDQLAKRRGLYFGCAVRPDQLRAEQDLRETVIQQCSHITPEISLKWDVLERSRGELDFSDADDIASFAARYSKEMRGHTLLWHKSVPAWAVPLLREKDGWRTVSRYFSSVIPRYGDVARRWDVVNEPVEIDDQRSDGLRNNVFLSAFGPGYIANALEEARIFSPHADLTINEYGLEYDSEEQQARRRALLNLLEGLRKENTPITGLGLQSHLDLRRGTVSQPSLKAFLKEVTDLGLFVEVTELDVKESAYTASMVDRDMMVADEVNRYLDILLDAAPVKGVSTWGISDRHSWLEVTEEDYARFPGAWQGDTGPGLNRGLPYDAAMRPKMMYAAIAKAFGE
jgi:endo-1,4-beta-xylanase